MSKTAAFLENSNSTSTNSFNVSSTVVHPLSFHNLILGMLVAAFLSYVLSAYYIRYGKSLSNRLILAKDFILITLTTTLIITIVKSSLALSLGLVGALSIIRFRAAIKEPEELAYLFLAISIGLGCGADQWKLTAIAFFIILCLVHIQNFRSSYMDLAQSLFINVEVEEKNHSDLLDKLIQTLRVSSDLVDLRRLDVKDNSMHTTFLVQLKRGASIQESISAIQKLQPSATISFVDQSQRAEL